MTPTQFLVRDINDKRLGSKEVGLLYYAASALEYAARDTDMIEWDIVDAAIATRFSPQGLREIRNQVAAHWLKAAGL